MKVGLILFELTASGGEQRQVLRFAHGLLALNHQVTIYAYRYSPAVCYPNLTSGLDIRAVHTLEEEGLPTFRSAALGLVSVAARRYFFESHVLAGLIGKEEEALNPHGRPAHRAAVFAKRRTGVPIVWTCNDLVSWEKPGHRARVGKFAQACLAGAMLRRERAIVREIDASVALSEDVRQTFEGAYGCPAHVVHPGVDCDYYTEQPEGARRLRRVLGIPEDAFLVLWLGVYEPFRRIEDLLKAVHILRSKGELVYCVIAGRSDTAPSYAQRLKQFVLEHGLTEQVCFAEGNIPEAEIPDYYSSCDVFVFPNDEQSWGMAPLEALACGRPVVVSRGSGVQEVLEDGETALLVPARRPEDVAGAILRLKHDPALRERIRCKGRQLVAHHLSWGHSVGQMEVLLNRVTGARGCDGVTAPPKRVPGGDWFGRLARLSEPVWRIR